MNKRLTDLYEQAAFETEYDDQQDLKEMMQRFAELIVKECIDQVEVFNTRMDASPKHIVVALNHHFGVKE